MTIKRYPHGSFGTPGAEHPNGSFVLFSDHEHTLAEKDAAIHRHEQVIADLRIEATEQSCELERLRGQVADLDKICKYHQRIEADMLKHHDDIFKEAVNFAEWVQDAYPFGESRRNAATSFLMSQDVKDWRLRQSEGYKAYFATPAATALLKEDK